MNKKKNTHFVYLLWRNFTRPNIYPISMSKRCCTSLLSQLKQIFDDEMDISPNKEFHGAKKKSKYKHQTHIIYSLTHRLFSIRTQHLNAEYAIQFLFVFTM